MLILVRMVSLERTITRKSKSCTFHKQTQPTSRQRQCYCKQYCNPPTHPPPHTEHTAKHTPGSISNEAVSLHLAQPQPTVPGSPLGGLAREDRARPFGPGVHLVHHHVLQLLVVDGPKVDVRFQRLSARKNEHERLQQTGPKQMSLLWVLEKETNMRQTVCNRQGLTIKSFCGFSEMKKE